MKIYSEKKGINNAKKIYILGIRIYEKDEVSNEIERSFFGGILKSKKNPYSTKLYFFGIKFYSKTEKIKRIEDKIKTVVERNNMINNHIKSLIAVSNQHQKVFPQFKNIHKEKECVIVATGPTLNYYEPIKDAIHIGVNSAFKKVNLDYLFSCDLNPIRDFAEELKTCNFIKFFGQIYKPYPDFIYKPHNGHIPNSYIESCKNAFKYYSEQANYQTINIDIETQMLPDLGSCVFQAVYFALYTGVKKLYLVGCDCSRAGHWNGAPATNGCTNILTKSWQTFKEYAAAFYPDVEIVSINPIGLKGMFEEIYTQSYIDDYQKEDNEIQKNASDNKEENIFYLKVNSEAYFSLQSLQNWVNIVEEMDADYYIICDKSSLKANILKNIKFKNPDIKFIKSRRIRLSKVIENITTPNWRNAGFSHLTTFYHARENGIKHFWNIDADDTVILEHPKKVVEALKSVQDYAESKDISIFSLDMWRSRSRSKQWTFGVTYTKNVDKFIEIFNNAKNAWMKKYQGLDDGLNVDWFVTYLKDNKIVKAETFYLENCYFIHYANQGSFLNNTMGSQICYWKENKLYFPILNNVLKDEKLGTIPIAEDCIKFDLGIEEDSCLKFLNTKLQDCYSDALKKLWHIENSTYANI